MAICQQVHKHLRCRPKLRVWSNAGAEQKRHQVFLLAHGCDKRRHCLLRALIRFVRRHDPHVLQCTCSKHLQTALCTRLAQQHTGEPSVHAASSPASHLQVQHNQPGAYPTHEHSSRVSLIDLRVFEKTHRHVGMACHQGRRGVVRHKAQQLHALLCLEGQQLLQVRRDWHGLRPVLQCT